MLSLLQNKTQPTPLLGTQAGPPETPQGMNSGIGGSNFGSKFSSPLTPRPSAMALSHAAASSSNSSSSNTSGGQAALWANTRFSNDRDGKMAEKFRRLMGVKNTGECQLFAKQIEMLRLLTI